MLASNEPNIPPSTEVVSTTPMQPPSDADDIPETVTSSTSPLYPNQFAICSPSLPWEVIERVIGHCGDDPESLHNFSLTCRDLRPRALCLLVADVRFKCRDDIFDFCDFVKDKPHLKPLVRSIAVHPEDFAPFPLLSILPNLSKLEFTRTSWQRPMTPVTPLNQSALKCSRLFGMHIQALHFRRIAFRTYSDFAQILLTFPNLAELVCDDVVIQSEGGQAALHVLKQRMSKRLHLHTVSLKEPYSQPLEEGSPPTPSAAVLLLDSGLIQSTVKALTIPSYKSYNLSHAKFAWPHLRSLVLESNFTLSNITNAIVILQNFPSSTLQHVTVKFQSVSIGEITKMLGDEASSRQCKELDQTLTNFSQGQGVCNLYVRHNGASLFWTQELRKHFPKLSNRGSFIVTKEKYDPEAGHEDTVQDLTVSPNGKWVATASRDSTIILWDSFNGVAIYQWVAHSYKPINSLAFSPDGRHLASGGDDCKIRIWDLAEGFCNIATLEGHTGRITCCAWSPRGDRIGSTSGDETMQLWDAHTFHNVHVHPVERSEDQGCQLLDNQSLTFSPNGHWLICTYIFAGSSNYWLWNIDSGTLQESFLDNDSANFTGTFDPSSTRLLVAEEDMLKVIEIETGEELAVLETSKFLTYAAFLPDGATIITTSLHENLVLWDADSGVELYQLADHGDLVHNVCFSPCGKYVASGSDNGTVQLRRTRDGSSVAACVEGYSEVLHVAFSMDGETLWCGYEDGNVIMRRMCDIVKEEESSTTPPSNSTLLMHNDANEPERAEGDPDRSYEGCGNQGGPERWREPGCSYAPVHSVVEQENMEGSETSIAGDNHGMLATSSRSSDSTAPTLAAMPIIVDDISSWTSSSMPGTSLEPEAAAFPEQSLFPEYPHPESLEDVYSAERAQATLTSVELENDSHVYGTPSPVDHATYLPDYAADEHEWMQAEEAMRLGPSSREPSSKPSRQF